MASATSGPHQWYQNCQSLITLERYEEAEEWLHQVIEKVLDIGYQPFLTVRRILGRSYYCAQDIATVLLSQLGYIQIRQRKASRAEEALKMLNTGLTIAKRCTQASWQSEYYFILALAYSECTRYRRSLEEKQVLSKAAVDHFQQAVNFMFPNHEDMEASQTNRLMSSFNSGEVDTFQTKTYQKLKTKGETKKKGEVRIGGFAHEASGGLYERAGFMSTTVHLDRNGLLKPDALLALWELLVTYKRVKDGASTRPIERRQELALAYYGAQLDLVSCWGDLIPRSTIYTCGPRFLMFAYEPEEDGYDWHRYSVHEPSLEECDDGAISGESISSLRTSGHFEDAEATPFDSKYVESVSLSEEMTLVTEGVARAKVEPLLAAPSVQKVVFEIPTLNLPNLADDTGCTILPGKTSVSCAQNESRGTLSETGPIPVTVINDDSRAKDNATPASMPSADKEPAAEDVAPHSDMQKCDKSSNLPAPIVFDAQVFQEAKFNFGADSLPPSFKRPKHNLETSRRRWDRVKVARQAVGVAKDEGKSRA
ncbi:MAG: hypothetical protein Q9227_008406 [Pyrenula ochraceoflavens]